MAIPPLSFSCSRLAVDAPISAETRRDLHFYFLLLILLLSLVGLALFFLSLFTLSCRFHLPFVGRLWSCSHSLRLALSLLRRSQSAIIRPFEFYPPPELLPASSPLFLSCFARLRPLALTLCVSLMSHPLAFVHVRSFVLFASYLSLDCDLLQLLYPPAPSPLVTSFRALIFPLVAHPLGLQVLVSGPLPVHPPKSYDITRWPWLWKSRVAPLGAL